MKLTPQEQYLYNHHLKNLVNGGAIYNPDGSVSTVLQRVVGRDGKYYNIPSVWDGQQLDERGSIDMASKTGWNNWPSYKSPEEADARYMQMHDAMAGDIGRFTAYPTGAFAPQQGAFVGRVR